MPVTGATKTIFEVRREQRWRIWLLFALLLLVIYAGVWLACLLVAVWAEVLVPTGMALSLVLDLRNSMLILGIAVLVSLVYWFGAQLDARERLWPRCTAPRWTRVTGITSVSPTSSRSCASPRAGRRSSA